MVGPPSIRAPLDAILPCRLYATRFDRSHRLSKSAVHLQYSIPGGERDVAHHRRRSQALGCRDRLFRRAPHLGSKSAASPALTLCRSRWRSFSRWDALDLLSARFLPPGSRAGTFVPPPFVEVSRKSLRCRKVAIFLRPRGMSPTEHLLALPRSRPQERMGGLCQATLLRTGGRPQICRTLHAPRRHLQ